MRLTHFETSYSFAVERDGKPSSECDVYFNHSHGKTWMVNVWYGEGCEKAKLIGRLSFTGVPTDNVGRRFALQALTFPSKEIKVKS